jgi:hypothetical protein
LNWTFDAGTYSADKDTLVSDVSQRLGTHPLVSAWALLWILGGRPTRERPRVFVELADSRDRGELLRLCTKLMERHAFKFPMDDGTIDFRTIPWKSPGQIDLGELNRYAYARQTELGGG